MQNNFIEYAILAALKAGSIILSIYETGNFQATEKQDKSPITIADKAAHECIIEILNETKIPVISEESKDHSFELRKDYDIFWMVDPLDGTKEFIKRNGDFTVNIALIEKNKPIAGVVYVPVSSELYFSFPRIGAYKIDKISYKPDIKINVNNLIKLAFKLPLKIQKNEFTVVASLTHSTPETLDFIEKLRQEHGKLNLISRGSSLKICMLAEGKADIYPRFAPTMEWDTAAGHAILLLSGGRITKPDEITELEYNKENLLNPFFIASINLK